MEISFPTDSDGFLSQECPSCEQQFKVCFGEGSNEPISCCPYCGHKSQQCWYTKEQVDHLSAVAKSVLVVPALAKLQQSIGGKVTGRISAPQTPPPIDPDSDLPIFNFPCCNETIKALQHTKLFCIIYGKEIDLNMSDAKKVFLSHKGLDKDNLVNEFKDTLRILGYDPWIDEDAMPAGTPLERGLLQGMEDSCGVVFFLTPSFKDDGYLATEVDYAMQQKRKKGDKFAIVPLQFADKDGKTGAIPELLKIYVWKTPKTQLQALREIVRALPIECTSPDWRDGIDDVVRTPKTKSTTTELSDEAKKLLKIAAVGDGSIQHVKNHGSEQIHIGRKNTINLTEARTVALWVGGLEDLLRRRYIKDCGHERKEFKLTREGFGAADELQTE
jgi:Zn ribbon nucleic-acid-binding protein